MISISLMRICDPSSFLPTSYRQHFTKGLWQSQRERTLTCRVVVKDGVLAEGLEAPRHYHVLELGRGGVVTFEDDRGK